MAGVAATFSPATVVDPDELAAQWAMIAHHDGHLLLPRLIRYIEERRRSEARFTGAIERHPSPLTVVWGGDDPIAVPAMTDGSPGPARLRRHRLLDGVGHYPMVEAPTASSRRCRGRASAARRARPGAETASDRADAPRRGRPANQPSGDAAHRRQAAAKDARSSGRGDAVGQQLLGQRRLGEPVGPQPAPPGPVLRRGEAPGRGGGGHRGEPGPDGPRPAAGGRRPSWPRCAGSAPRRRRWPGRARGRRGSSGSPGSRRHGRPRCPRAGTPGASRPGRPPGRRRAGAPGGRGPRRRCRRRTGGRRGRRPRR